MEDRYNEQVKKFHPDSDKVKTRLVPDVFESLPAANEARYIPVQLDAGSGKYIVLLNLVARILLKKTCCLFNYLFLY